MTDEPSGESDDAGDGELADMIEQFEELEATVDTDAEREQVRAARKEALEAVESGRVFGRVVRGFDRSDVAEALLGSVLFGIPMLVEDGTLEAGAFIAGRPLYLGGTVLFELGLVAGILYVADIQDVRMDEPLVGFVPRRFVGVIGIAFLTSLVLATAWGRVDWADPQVALAQVMVAAVPMSIGGALGDILPGS